MIANSRKIGGAVSDALIEEVRWPRSKLSAPVKQMRDKLDAWLVSLRDKSWHEGLREHVLRCKQRMADQTKNDCAGQEFQILIEQSERNVNLCKEITEFGKAARPFLKHDTDAGAVTLSKGLKPLICHLEQMKLNELYCTLHIHNASWLDL